MKNMVYLCSHFVGVIVLSMDADDVRVRPLMIASFYGLMQNAENEDTAARVRADLQQLIKGLPKEVFME